MPGVPDVYQGTELWDHSLVDPDNRRPVDFDAAPRRCSPALDAGGVPPVDASGAAKLLVTSRALRLRRDRPELFTGYRADAGRRGTPPGTRVAFDRGGALTRRHPAAGRAGAPPAAGATTTLELPPARWRDVLTGPAVGGDVGSATCSSTVSRSRSW